MDPTKKWKKNLYENPGFPDNYTSELFLKELQINTKLQPIKLLTCMKNASVVTQELCTVVLFVLVFVYLLNKWVEPSFVFVSTSFVASICFIYYRNSNKLQTSVRQDIRTLLIFLVFGQIFSPILHTLTDTISTDTIYTMTALMMFIHLVFFDYGLSVAVVSNSLSLSAAMFGSICLASRLDSAFHAFVLMTTAVECFVLKNKLNLKLFGAVFITILTLYVLYSVSYTMVVLLGCALLFINLLCPLIFVQCQKYKNNIYGPWDEAIVDDLDNIQQIQ